MFSRSCSYFPVMLFIAASRSSWVASALCWKFWLNLALNKPKKTRFCGEILSGKCQYQGGFPFNKAEIHTLLPI